MIKLLFLNFKSKAVKLTNEKANCRYNWQYNILIIIVVSEAYSELLLLSKPASHQPGTYLLSVVARTAAALPLPPLKLCINKALKNTRAF